MTIRALQCGGSRGLQRSRTLDPRPPRHRCPQPARLRLAKAGKGGVRRQSQAKTARAVHLGRLFSLTQPAPHPHAPPSDVIPDADNIRTLLVKPVHPLDATFDRLHGNPDKPRCREAIAEEIEATVRWSGVPVLRDSRGKGQDSGSVGVDSARSPGSGRVARTGRPGRAPSVEWLARAAAALSHGPCSRLPGWGGTPLRRVPLLLFDVHHPLVTEVAKLGMQQFRRLSADRLNAMPKEIQRLSKTRVPGSAEPFSLDTLRAQLNSR